MEAYRFNDAAERALSASSGTSICDWYLELAKPVLDRRRRRGQGRDPRAWSPGCSTRSLQLLHPFMPFITEELVGGDGIARRLAGAGAVVAQDRDVRRRDVDAGRLGCDRPDGRAGDVVDALSRRHRISPTTRRSRIGWVVDLVTAIRSVRAEMNITPSTLTPLVLAGASADTDRAGELLERCDQAAGAGRRDLALRTPPRRAPCSSWCAARSRRCPRRAWSILGAEQVRLEKELGKAEADIKRAEAKLANEKFVANAAGGSRRGRTREARGRARPQGQDPRSAAAAEERVVGALFKSQPSSSKSSRSEPLKDDALR
ncbi:MAG: class I tRNA ligase family protein [Rhodopseudomonas palustris]|nr:class I tRNA ligase family protein [Rhodopseudomonas palustris]